MTNSMIASNLLFYINDSLTNNTAKQYKIPVNLDSHDIVKYGISNSGRNGIAVYSEGYELVEVYFFERGTCFEMETGRIHFSKCGDEFLIIIGKKTQDDGHIQFRTLVYTGDVWFEFFVRNPRYFKGLLQDDHFISATVPFEYDQKEIKACMDHFEVHKGVALDDNFTGTTEFVNVYRGDDQC